MNKGHLLVFTVFMLLLVVSGGIGYAIAGERGLLGGMVIAALLLVVLTTIGDIWVMRK